MTEAAGKLLVVQVAGLGYDFLQGRDSSEWRGLVFHPMESPFPALTCTVQAGFRTGQGPSRHGVVSNGVFSRELMRPFFWEQSASLVTGPRVWDSLRRRGKRVAMLFWQQSLGESVDIVISPAPIHRHDGDMVPACYSKPRDLYPRLCAAVGRKFDLKRYWGPLASAKSSDWIAEATAALIRDESLAPDLCLTYLPVLDYSLQRYGPADGRSRKALDALLAELRLLLIAAREANYEVVVFGDYAIGPSARGAAFPNQALRRAGFLREREVEGRKYADLWDSAAFAMVDHEIAHVYVKRPADVEPVQRLLANLPGVGEVLTAEAQRNRSIAHPRCGDLLLIAAEGYWFAYPWWEKRGEEPDYAGHVDIHNKPGYDPCELFFGWPPFSVSRRASRIRGSHGRNGADRRTCWAATWHVGHNPVNAMDLALTCINWFDQKH